MKSLMILFGSIYVGLSYANVTCYLNVVKGSCWNNSNVDVSIIDSDLNKTIAHAQIKKDTGWQRVSFPCRPNQTLYYSAVYSPVFWEADKGKVYNAKQYWSLPKQLKAGDVAWELTICFPKDFSGVPLPPTGSGECACQYNLVTPLKLKEKN